MISDECSFEDYEEFFKAYIKFRERKKRDNDYNPLLVIRSMSDEVRLHSRFLHSFLNTEGWHYQEDLFLEPFLECLDLKNFFKNTESVRVRKECDNIDLYLNDGINHLIIENKIYAGDGKEQISRYIETIKDKGVEYENIAVVYLSPYERTPSQESLNEWSIKEGKWLVKKDNEKIIYKNATYKKEITEWIEKCQKKCKNISNLYMSFEFYKECVKILIGEKKMGLEEFLKDNKDKREKFIKIIAEIKKQRAEELSVEMFRQKHERIIEDLNTLSDEKFEEKYEFKKQEYLYKDYEDLGKATIIKDRSKTHFIFRFCHKKYKRQTFKLMLTLIKTSEKDITVAFRLHNKYDKEIKSAAEISKIISDKTKFALECNCLFYEKDKGEFQQVDLSKETLEEYFERLYRKVEQLNEFLLDEENNPKSRICELAKELEQNNSTQGGKS